MQSLVNFAFYLILYYAIISSTSFYIYIIMLYIFLALLFTFHRF